MVFFTKIKHILNSKIGIDKAIGYTLSARIIQAVGSFVSLYLIALYLTKEEQGFYYTFGSILAIQVFFELGFNGIITQYAAHESAYIFTYEKSLNETEYKAQSRLSSLLQFCIKWFSILSIALFIILLIVGYVFFDKYGHGVDVNWKLPWLILVINTSLSFVLSPLFSFLEGIGRVKDMAKLRLVQQSVNLVVLWTMLSSGGQLYSAPIAGLFSLFVILCIFLFSDFRPVLLKIWQLIGEYKVSYKMEIFPYQWKIALSWISGYFIFQLFNPVLFATDGAVVAGQMGMTLAVLNGIQSLSMSWMSTKVPLYSNLIALKDYKPLDSIFGKTLKQSAFISALALIVMFLLIYFIRNYHILVHGMNLGERFLSYTPMLLMMGALFLNQFVFSWATYLRCHKKEPYLFMSIITGILCMLSTVFLGKYFGVIGITLGYFFITACYVVWAYNLFIYNKKIWHE